MKLKEKSIKIKRTVVKKIKALFKASPENLSIFSLEALGFGEEQHKISNGPTQIAYKS